MKKLQLFIIGVLAMLTATSCNDYFDQVPGDRLSMEEIFSTRDGVLGYLATVYTFLPDEFNQRHLHEGNLHGTQGPWTGASDEAQWALALETPKSNLINYNTLDATEGTFLKNRWKSWYSGIHEADVFTSYVERTSAISANERTQWKAEARALKAIYYFYLVRAYGPVPIVPSNLSINTPNNELQFSRNTVDECFDYIVSELKAAQNSGLLDNATSDKTTGNGRIDKAIAQAFIIEALTYRASWLFNGECTYYADLANPDGTKLFPNMPDAATKRANWQKVIDECNLFFSNYSNRYKLTYTDKEGETVSGPDADSFNPMISYRNAVTVPSSNMNSNKEMIFYLNWNNAGTMQYDRMPNMQPASNDSRRGGSLLNATQEMVDAYFMANGQSPITGYASDGITPIINEASGYVEKGTCSSDYTAADGLVYAYRGTNNMYVNREPRFYADITFHNSKWFEGVEGTTTIDFTSDGNCGMISGKNDYTCTGYLVRKCMDPAFDRNRSLILVLLRLPNIYFDYVEALAHVNPTHSDIWKYINEIRTRAGIPGYGTSALPTPTTTEEVMEIIRKEKRVELSFENCRYFDIRRWGLASDILNRDVHGMNVRGAEEMEFFNRTYVTYRTFERQYFFPIPQGEIDIDKNLVQNTGY